MKQERVQALLDLIDRASDKQQKASELLDKVRGRVERLLGNDSDDADPEPDIDPDPEVIEPPDDEGREEDDPDPIPIVEDFGANPDDTKWDAVEIWTGGEIDGDAKSPLQKLMQRLKRQDGPGKRLLMLIDVESADEVKMPWVPDLKGSLTVAGRKGAPKPILQSSGNSTLSFGGVNEATAAHMDTKGIVYRFRGASGRSGEFGYAAKHISLLGLTICGSKQDGVLANRCDLEYINKTFGEGRPTLRIEDCEIFSTGQANVYHGCYMSSRGAEATVKNCHFHGMNDSICLKLMTDWTTIENCKFSTINNPDDGYYGQTFINLPACGWSTIKNCEFDAHVYGNRGSAQAIQYRARRLWQACDRPPYGSDEFNDPAYWAAIRERGAVENNRISDPEHPDAFLHTVENCKFGLKKRHPDQDWKYGYRPAVLSQGTFPRSRVAKFSADSIFHEAPEGWVERAIVVLKNCTFDGYDEDKLTDGRHDEPMWTEGGMVANHHVPPERALIIK